jgi:outer membrane protein W
MSARLALLAVVLWSASAFCEEDELAPLTHVPAPAAAKEAAPAAEAAAPARFGFFFRVGLLVLSPAAVSSEVSLVNVTGASRLAVSDGPIAGSSVGLGTNFMPAAIIGYTLPFWGRHLSVETVLALPFTLKMYARGSLADTSLAPTVLGTLPTGLPPLGEELGEARVLPPVLTLTWRFGPFGRFNPYAGLGFSYLMTLDARITNPILTEVSTPHLSIPNAAGFVLQAGCDVHVWERFFVSADFKYIAGLDLTAKVTDIYVRLPKLPLYDAVRVGDNEVKVTVNPLVFTLGVGMDL